MSQLETLGTNEEKKRTIFFYLGLPLQDLTDLGVFLQTSLLWLLVSIQQAYSLQANML